MPDVKLIGTNVEVSAELARAQQIQRISSSSATVNRPTPPKKCIHLGRITSKVFPPKDGLGDAIESMLTAVKIPGICPDGLTKKRWAEIKHAINSELDAEDCSGCQRRQRWWNRLGNKFNIGTSPEQRAQIEKVLRLENEARTPVYKCEVHGDCLPAVHSTVALDIAPMTCARCRKEGLGYEPIT